MSDILELDPDNTSLEEAVFRTIGAAAACWDESGVFDTQQASQVGEELLAYLAETTRASYSLPLFLEPDDDWDEYEDRHEPDPDEELYGAVCD